jgi:thioesterase domain-containing protein/acyl carrier protein
MTPNLQANVVEKLPPPAVTPAQPPAPVRNAFEAELLALWCELLERDLGVDDNFFEAGGDSLSAVDLALCIGERLGVELTLTTLLANPTVADLALALLRGRHADTCGRVLKLGRSASATQPLFLLPPGSGAGLVYAGLARELSGYATCYALQAVGLDGGAPGSHTMEALAAQFIVDVDRLQPTGDVQLCGYSAGGPVAHEMARQLAERGRRVSRLVLLDPHRADHSDLPGGAPPETGLAVFRSACRDMLWDAFGLRGAAAEQALQAAKRLRALGLARTGADLASAGARRALAQARRVLPPRTDLQLFLLLLEGVDNLCHAGALHRPRPLPRFDGEAWFIQPSADAEAFRQARRTHWQRLVGVGLRTRVVAGDHATLLQRAATVVAIGALLKSAFEPMREAA